MVSGIVLFLIFGIFVAGNFAHADFVADGVNLLTSIIGSIVNALGKVLTMIMAILIQVADYNGFITSTAVTNGWVLVRDLCNMFFILILLVIAFATILRVEGYDIKKMVPKLIIMAILINFSKTICGLIIDAAQLIMNTFVSAFNISGGVKLTQMLGLNDLLTIQTAVGSANTAADAAGIFSAYLFALVYVIIALVVLIVLLCVLVYRIIMLWIYIILSPLAYLLATFPQGQKYVSQWWDEFTKNVIVGPVLAFFLWLSFVSLGNANSGSSILGFNVADSSIQPAGLTKIMTTDDITKFIISIGMLLGGLIIAQQMGGAVGKIAGAGMAKLQGGAKFLQKKATRAVTDTAKMGGAAAMGIAGGAALGLGKIQARTGLGTGKSLQALGRVGTSGAKGIVGGIAKEKAADWSKTLKKVGLGGPEQQKAIQEFANTRLAKGGKTALRVGGGALAGIGAASFIGPAGLLAAVPGIVHLGRHVATGRAAKKAGEYNKLKNTRDNKISAAQAEHDEKIKPYDIKRQADEKSYLEEKNIAIKSATTFMDNSLGQAKNYVRTLDPSYKGREEEHQYYKNKKEEAEKEYKKKVNEAEEGYTKKINPIEVEFKAKTKPIEVEFEEKKKRAETDYDNKFNQTDLGKLRTQKSIDLAAIDANSNLKPLEKKTQKEKVEKDYGEKENNLAAGVGANLPAALRDMIKGYHPNKVTMDATKEAIAIQEGAKKLADAFGAGASTLLELGDNSFYNAEGQSEKSKERLKSFAGNDKALENMVKQLRIIAAKTGGPGAKEAKIVKNLKQGLAALSKGGGDISKFSEVINVSNQIPNNGPDFEPDNKTVDDFKDIVIEKA